MTFVLQTLTVPVLLKAVVQAPLSARRSGGFAIRHLKRLDLFPCGLAFLIAHPHFFSLKSVLSLTSITFSIFETLIV